jgi:hypothetical protein
MPICIGTLYAIGFYCWLALEVIYQSLYERGSFAVIDRFYCLIVTVCHSIRKHINFSSFLSSSFMKVSVRNLSFHPQLSTSLSYEIDQPIYLKWYFQNFPFVPISTFRLHQIALLANPDIFLACLP